MSTDGILADIGLLSRHINSHKLLSEHCWTSHIACQYATQWLCALCRLWHGAPCVTSGFPLTVTIEQWHVGSDNHRMSWFMIHDGSTINYRKIDVFRSFMFFDDKPSILHSMIKTPLPNSASRNLVKNPWSSTAKPVALVESFQYLLMISKFLLWYWLFSFPYGSRSFI